MFLIGEYDYEMDVAVQREEAFAKGKNEKALETAKNLLKLNILSLEQISSVVNLPIEQLQEIQKTL